MAASQLKIIPKNLVRWHIGTPKITLFFKLKKINKYIIISDPESDGKELILQDLNKKVLKWYT